MRDRMELYGRMGERKRERQVEKQIETETKKEGDTGRTRRDVGDWREREWKGWR